MESSLSIPWLVLPLVAIAMASGGAIVFLTIQHKQGRMDKATYTRNLIMVASAEGFLFALVLGAHLVRGGFN